MQHDRPTTTSAYAFAICLLAGLNAGCAVKDVPPSSSSRDERVGDGLHVPSPDWRDQVIYFAMIDRFDDGDPGNNDQGAGEFDPTQNARYSGGDLAGLTRRVDYIRGLGATTLWITPPVANRWWDEAAQYGGYHGYWAENFVAVDRHYGTLAEYQQLSRTLHAAGMYLVQDIVVNHTGNYFSYPQTWSDSDPAKGFVLQADRSGRTAPTQWPFTQNDARKAADRAASIYHWTPSIGDHRSTDQTLRYQLADLDDLDTENPVVRDTLRDSYAYWIGAVGVDGFRVDTAFYVAPAFFADFLHGGDARHPGILQAAAASGRNGFHVFGEGFAMDKPFEDVQARRIDRYMRAADGTTLLPGMINFPLYGSLGDVFARGHPTAELGARIRSMMRVHAQPHLMPSFVDNHDVDRFLSGGSDAGLRQALLAILTLPGIPTIYYGTEQGFTAQRAAMFATGHGAGGVDHFDTGSPLYRFLRDAIALRRDQRVLSRGTPAVLDENAAAPGVLAYRMQDGADAAIVVFNTADRASLVDRLDTGLRPGTVLHGLFGLVDTAHDRIVDSDGRISLVLAPREGLVWRVGNEVRPLARAIGMPSIDPLPAPLLHGDFVVSGDAVGADELLLVLDGDLANARRVMPDAQGRWRTEVDTASLIDPDLDHQLVAWDARGGRASLRRRFRVARQWRVLADQSDPAGDDSGPSGAYRYPDDAGWGSHRQLDLRSVQVSGSGGALRVALTMNDVTDSWNPANGFDHVAVTMFLQLPDRGGGVRAMPLQNAELPGGMRWHYRLRAHGWTNALYSAEGADAGHEGTPATPGARIEVDRGRARLVFSFPAAAIGSPASLSGARLYVTTWDYDGGYRPLQPAAGTHAFSGGDGRNEPLVMDDAMVRLP